MEATDLVMGGNEGSGEEPRGGDSLRSSRTARVCVTHTASEPREHIPTLWPGSK